MAAYEIGNLECVKSAGHYIRAIEFAGPSRVVGAKPRDLLQTDRNKRAQKVNEPALEPLSQKLEPSQKYEGVARGEGTSYMKAIHRLDQVRVAPQQVRDVLVVQYAFTTLGHVTNDPTANTRVHHKCPTIHGTGEDGSEGEGCKQSTDVTPQRGILTKFIHHFLVKTCTSDGG
jgi:hypothetical protein